MAPTLTLELENRSNSSQVYAYVTGQSLTNNNHIVLVSADGHTPYYPPSPPHPVHPLEKDCAIPLGRPGSTTSVTVPLIAGGRIWFSLGPKKLSFFVNPGPSLIEPSVTNGSDPNIDVEWAFCEFTFSQGGLYANISYVDFVSLAVSMKLTTTDGKEQNVLGLKPNGLKFICDGLKEQAKKDGQPWDKLVVEKEGRIVRALSPNNGLVMTGGQLFKGYYDGYVNQVWEKYSKAPLLVNTQAQWGKLQGRVSNNHLTFDKGLGTFPKPSTADIFSCSTGPFANNAGATGPLTARISAGFNRSTLLSNDDHPDKEKTDQFYKNAVTNHYSRLVHAANLDERGYAFPYDDVPAGAGGVDQSGFVNGMPRSFKVSIG